jgi:predicted PhzF superfamily epimerase YddE/YHI9
VSDPRLQQIAAEMNLSETAFVVPREGDHTTSPSFDLRWCG